tara:strand:- start:826 stop:1122 length:297 start_codon:yes stop_codon:yes gene_type:complete
MLNSQEFQQGIQAQQLVSNAGQQAITNETQGRAAIEGMQKVQELSAAQKAQKGLQTGVALGVYTLKGKDSELARMSDPNYTAAKMASVAQQSRLKGLA